MIHRIQKIKPPSPAMAALLAVLILAGLILFDNLIHDPINQPTVHLILIAVNTYQHFLSHPLSNFGTCKFTPTCSEYMKLAVMKYGSAKGVAKGILRICRCSPFTDQFGYDYP